MSAHLQSQSSVKQYSKRRDAMTQRFYYERVVAYGIYCVIYPIGYNQGLNFHKMLEFNVIQIILHLISNHLTIYYE